MQNDPCKSDLYLAKVPCTRYLKHYIQFFGQEENKDLYLGRVGEEHIPNNHRLLWCRVSWVPLPHDDHFPLPFKIIYLMMLSNGYTPCRGWHPVLSMLSSMAEFSKVPEELEFYFMKIRNDSLYSHECAKFPWATKHYVFAQLNRFASSH